MKFNKATVIRTAVLILALVNQGLNLAGKNILPFTADEVSTAITYAFTAGTALWTWWKNNSFTQHAVAADEHLKQLKSKKDEQE